MALRCSHQVEYACWSLYNWKQGHEVSRNCAEMLFSCFLGYSNWCAYHLYSLNTNMIPSVTPTVHLNISDKGETISAPQRTCPVTEVWPCFVFHFPRNFNLNLFFVSWGVHISTCIYACILLSTRASKAESSQNYDLFSLWIFRGFKANKSPTSHIRLNIYIHISHIYIYMLDIFDVYYIYKCISLN